MFEASSAVLQRVLCFFLPAGTEDMKVLDRIENVT